MYGQYNLVKHNQKTMRKIYMSHAKNGITKSKSSENIKKIVQ